MYIDSKGNRWYRGNLHTHTTVSDGAKSPEETKALYREMGYDFIAITDHWVYASGDEYDPTGLLVLSGAEYNYNGEDVLSGVFHIVGFGMTRDPIVKKEDGAQGAINKINDCGGLAIIAHPAWSMNTYDMITPLHGLFATEIYNSVSGFPRNCRPYSGIIVDQLAARGYILPLIADDDTHFHTGEQGMSYIMVNLGNNPLTRENLIGALKENKFIATQGPIFEACRMGDEIVITMETPAQSVTFFTNRPWEPNRNAHAFDTPLYEARFRVHPNDTFVRAEVIGTDGKLGFAQIIKV